MKTMPTLTAIATALLSLQCAAEVTADAITTALKSGEAKVLLRYRYEYVDQDGVAEQAKASTLKSRLGWTSGTVSGVKAIFEIDNVSVVGNEMYNSTVNGLTQYPVVADPEATVVNQAALSWANDTTSLTAGRQRIIHGSERFLGSVAWRQLEQNFDAVRLMGTPVKDLNLDYSYSWRVNTVFGPDSTQGHRDGNVHSFTGGYALAEGQVVNASAYLLDFDDFAALSSNTYALDYSGSFSPLLGVKLALASQSDAGDAPVAYDALYYLAELSSTVSGVTFSAGAEVLGSDNGVKAFATPLATLHKFQGFADKFLATPNGGIEDLYIGASGKLGKLGYGLTWHDFSANEGNVDYGSEVDAVLTYPLTPYLVGMLKYASYSSDELFTDTDKGWAMVTASF